MITNHQTGECSLADCFCHEAQRLELPPSTAIPAPDFDYEWDAAPRSMKNYVEREIAEYFYLCGLRAEMRVEFENTNQTLRSLIGKLSQ